ncbi:RraA family protein [Actinoplanes xinjiangensis]|uniref:Putative 4-hydroxy-4-methyl-2-oxoglutarate aldolase n=1 Tax=Actinoplanes xinjiangensis TaxID=512350 RepID=A0A316ETM5_9ACTN|nr:RraA family protein [Actinoplanes xinjiangensis]PWK36087.1 4-hydroxy-4-methyl-2-oxoglutarate aldolase [Actinoplanes xinjiangensis]GIF42909.1 hypothetical protein Axi01nite_72200 [Actinoplanes xinjiangensis]
MTAPTVADRDAQLRRRFDGLGCAQLADAAGEFVTPLRLDLRPRNGRPRLCGPLFPVVTADDMLPCLQALASAPAGSVLFLHNTTTPSEALAGDIFVTSAAVQGLAGIIVNGAVRDLADLRDIDVPVFSTEVTFVSARTTATRSETVPAVVDIGGATLRPGDWIFADEDGFLVVEQHRVSAAITAAAVLRQREDGLKEAIRDTGRTLADLTDLTGFLNGEADLGFVP